MLTDFTNGQIKSVSAITLHVDGGCEPKNPGGIATAAWVAFDTEGNRLAEEARVVADGGPHATNNYAEYCALGFALRWLSDQGYHGNIHVKSDSKLIVHQVLKEWKCNPEHLKKLRTRIWELLDGMRIYVTNEANRRVLEESGLTERDQKFCVLTWVPRDQNECADSLGRVAYEAYLRERPKNRSRSKQPPPQKKRRPGEERFVCRACGHRGTVKELRIEDGGFCCPMCQASDIEF